MSKGEMSVLMSSSKPSRAAMKRIRQEYLDGDYDGETINSRYVRAA